MKLPERTKAARKRLKKHFRRLLRRKANEAVRTERSSRLKASHSIPATSADEEVRIETPVGTIVVQWDDDSLAILRIADGETVCVETWDLEIAQ